MRISYILFLACSLLPITTWAQHITFETSDYKSIGVYDSWENSPFRTGKMKGNYAVINNHLTAVDPELGTSPNPSKKILAIQRSRFGSNTFGVRVDLCQPFELTPNTQYLHVMIHRPYSGRVMVIGLGKRKDRATQSPETEQFWALSTTNVPGDRWYDVVLPIKGNGGIDIYSLVVIPDCESPHNYTEDQACYIDNIVINQTATPQITYGYYPVNFDKHQQYNRNDRYLTDIGLTTPKGLQKVDVSTSAKHVYVQSENTLSAQAGDTVAPVFFYQGSWMNGYVYIDYNNDGKFTTGKTPDSELVAFSYYGAADSGTNSKGEKLSGNEANVLNPPAFQIPQGLKNGYYRMRYKVDWNSIDPGGQTDTKNSIIANGGGIVDIRLHIHGDYCYINDANRNGEILTTDNKKLVKYEAKFGQPFTIRMNPEKGFDYAGIIVKHGYNLSGDSIVHDNLQWESVRFGREKFNRKNEFTIPGELMQGEVEIEGLFVETDKSK